MQSVMSIPTPTALPVLSRPTTDPPTTALPPIPQTKSRNSPPTVHSARTSSKLRPPTNSRPSALPNPLQAISTSDIPTNRSTSALGKADSGHSEKTIRKTISIGAFPEPPKALSRPGTATSPVSTTPGKKRISDGNGNTAQASTPRSKRLPRASTGSGGSSLRNSQTPSLLNGGGDGKSIPIVAHRISDGHSSVPSPPHSRSSSANGSYATSATTFEDGEDDRGRTRADENTATDSRRGSKAGAKETKGNVVVSVRVRPDASGQDPSQTEGEWMVDGRRSLVAYRGKEGGDYRYDNVFGTYDNNAKVYDSSAKRLVRRVMEGYHGTVFAYGMTGTGKTFSMQGTATNPGVIPLAITDIFSYIRETPHREFLLRVSYLEIYNEKIHDLLATPTGGVGVGAQQDEIKLREDSKRGVYASPLKEEIVQSPTQLLRVIARGDHARRTGSTQYNARSSRSHAVVQIVVESRERLPGSGTMQESKRPAMIPGGVRVSTLSLIDLAGSERAAEDKERRTEGAHINKSLLTLGTVIARLSGDKDKNGQPTDKDGKHLPYRDSKLTRLLQPALSGNSLVSILCTIQIGSHGSTASAINHTAETLNTLKFAARARNNIVSHAKKAAEEIGSGVNAGLLERYRAEIQSLRGQLEGQQKTAVEKEERQLEKEAEQRHEEQMLEMQLARTALKERIEHLNRLILCSKSTGVNSGTVSALGMHSRLSGGTNGDYGAPRSVRSSASHSTLGNAAPTLVRHPSGGSLGPSHRISFSPMADEDEEDGEFADGRASLKSQNRALQADLQDKNRYIATLEKRLLQARRSSHSRMSMGFNKNSAGPDEVSFHRMLEEKDSTIADLRARLDDKEKMVTALRSAARKRDMAELTPETSSAEFKLKKGSHQSSDSNSSSLNSTATSPPQQLTPITPISPMALLSPQKVRDKKRKSVDEMSRMLDEMIQDKVESGHLIKGRSGSVRIAVPSRVASRGHSRRGSSNMTTSNVSPISSLTATLRD
jgi:centromeric protein E